MMRAELLEVRLVAHRGLWDKFAAPGTLGAYVRAWRRRIPFRVDLDAGTVTLQELLDAGLLQQRDVLVLLVSSAPLDSFGGNVLIVESCHYLPLGATLTAPVQPGDLVFYESIDTIDSLDAMRASPIKSDDAIEAGLASAVKAGAVLMRVCDLAERELLLHSARWIVR
ncbi:MAG TPA: hypothetical protein VJ901_03050 [Thermoanaerobaculia bacterium]|nr:hypothetical protein [Thermoanaerobaculia bacterium]